MIGIVMKNKIFSSQIRFVQSILPHLTIKIKKMLVVPISQEKISEDSLKKY